MKEKSKSQKQIPKNKVPLELLHQRLGHRSTKSLLDGDTEFFWQDIELRVDPEPLCISCQISTINKKARPKTPLKPKTPFKWVFMGIIPSISFKILTKDTNFANYWVVDVHPRTLDIRALDSVPLYVGMFATMSTSPCHAYCQLYF